MYRDLILGTKARYSVFQIIGPPWHFHIKNVHFIQDMDARKNIVLPLPPPIFRTCFVIEIWQHYTILGA